MMKIIVFAVLVILLGACTPSEASIQTAIAKTETAYPASNSTSLAIATVTRPARPTYPNTQTQRPTAVHLTHTPAPSITPRPTNSPGPTNTPTLVPTPIVLAGTGDSIVDIEKASGPALVHIIGNASSRYFSVTNYDANGERIDLLVNTTDPYDGVRPLDFMAGEYTARFEVKSVGEWTIEVLPMASIERINIPGEISGTGDYVFAITGGTPDTAIISGNAESRYFSVNGYSTHRELLVNTTEVYNGTVMVSFGLAVFEVQATGEWTISFTTR